MKSKGCVVKQNPKEKIEYVIVNSHNLKTAMFIAMGS